jgi:hypothetical protein
MKKAITWKLWMVGEASFQNRTTAVAGFGKIEVF